MSQKSSLEKRVSKVKRQSARAVINQKTSNSIIAVNKQTKIQTPLKSYHEEYYVDLFSGAKKPVSDEYLSKCAAEWLNMVREEEVLLMTEYHVRKGIHPATWSNWMERSQELRDARDLVRCMIAIRRERGGLKNQYSAQWGLKQQYVYDPEWKESEEWRAKLAPKTENMMQPIQVILETFPSSPLVPVKKQREE